MRRANRRSAGGVPAAVSGVGRSSGLLVFMETGPGRKIGPSGTQGVRRTSRARRATADNPPSALYKCRLDNHLLKG